MSRKNSPLAAALSVVIIALAFIVSGPVAGGWCLGGFAVGAGGTAVNAMRRIR